MVSGFTACQRIASPRPPTAPDSNRICADVMVPITVGRPRVRAIAASIFCSTRQLNAAAAPATSAIPAVAASKSCAGGTAGEASSIPITAVKTMSETTRGLVRRQNCAPTPGTWLDVASMGGRYFNASTDLRRLEKCLQIFQHAAEIRAFRPAHHDVAARVHEVDVGPVARRTRGQLEIGGREHNDEILDGIEGCMIRRHAVVHDEDAL